MEVGSDGDSWDMAEVGRFLVEQPKFGSRVDGRSDRVWLGGVCV